MKELNMNAIIEESKDSKYLDLVEHEENKHKALTETCIIFVQDVLIGNSTSVLHDRREDIIKEYHLDCNEEVLYFNLFNLFKSLLDSKRAIVIIKNLFDSVERDTCESTEDLLIAFVLFNVVYALNK